MLTDATLILEWTSRLIAFAVALQSIEFIQLRQVMSANGVWTWNILASDFEHTPLWFQTLLRFTLGGAGVILLISFQLFISLTTLITPQPLMLAILTATGLLLALRWRGGFNGGSDAMTLTVLLALLISTQSSQPMFAWGALWYIALQSCFSYFVAGWVKIKSREWRSGVALLSFVRAASYAFPPHARLQDLLTRPYIARTASWTVIAFELSFPLSLLNPQLCLIYIGAGLSFHLINFYVFGLNRFVFAWAATYPALYFCSQWNWT